MESLRLFGRIAVAGVVVVVLMVALLLVRSLVSERAQFRDEAVARVGASRAGEQVLTGPLRVIPWTEQQLRVDEQGGQRMRTVHGHELQMPQQLQVDGQLLPEQRRVGMFKVPVYTWRGKLAARFAAFEPASVPGRVYGKPYLVMGIADVRGVVGTPVLQLDGRRALLQAGTQGLHDSIGGVHVPLLPDEAQEAMGQVHPRAQITFDILMREGFETEHYIDIFDGGPTLHARTSGIRSIAQSRSAPVKVEDAPCKGGRPYLVCNGQLQDYRAVLLDLDWVPGKPVCLSLAAADALGVGEGGSVRLVAV